MGVNFFIFTSVKTGLTNSTRRVTVRGGWGIGKLVIVNGIVG